MTERDRGSVTEVVSALRVTDDGEEVIVLSKDDGDRREYSLLRLTAEAARSLANNLSDAAQRVEHNRIDWRCPR
jgi:hypothetical protein